MLKKILLLITILSSIANANENDILGYWTFSSSGGLSLFGSIKISKEYIKWGTLNDTPFHGINKKYPCKAKYTLQINESNDYLLLLKNKSCLYSEMLSGTFSENIASFKIKILSETEAMLSDYDDKGYFNGEGLMDGPIKLKE